MKTTLCARHETALVTAVELRGLLDEASLTFARGAIGTHAQHFAGRAAVRLLADRVCAICFVNRALREDARQPGLTVDGWVENAADEALEADITRQDTQALVRLG